MLDGSLFRDLSGMFYVSGYLNRNSSLPKPLIYDIRRVFALTSTSSKT